MKIAFMFPGQGSQYIGMGEDLYNNSEIAREIFLKADTILNFPLSTMMFKGLGEDLTQTQNTQPAILTYSIALWKVLNSTISLNNFSVVGHSLGEYSAYIASGRLVFEDAVNLVRKRGTLMAQVSSPDYGMSAILKLETSKILDILEEYGNQEVFIANDNCLGQIVISGLKLRIEELTPMIKELGGRVMPLSVSGAFHSPYMKKVADELAKELDLITFFSSTIPLYSNINALSILNGQEKVSLVEQVYKGVLFTQSIQNMIKDGIDTFIEVGPGKVLQGLVKKIDPNVKVLGLENLQDIENISKELS